MAATELFSSIPAEQMNEAGIIVVSVTEFAEQYNITLSILQQEQ